MSFAGLPRPASGIPPDLTGIGMDMGINDQGHGGRKGSGVEAAKLKLKGEEESRRGPWLALPLESSKPNSL